MIRNLSLPSVRKPWPPRFPEGEGTEPQPVEGRWGRSLGNSPASRVLPHLEGELVFPCLGVK